MGIVSLTLCTISMQLKFCACLTLLLCGVNLLLANPSRDYSEPRIEIECDGKKIDRTKPWKCDSQPVVLCNGKKLEPDDPCDGKCQGPEEYFRICNGKCLHKNLPCDGKCEANQKPCQNACIPKQIPCEKKCRPLEYLCNKKCTHFEAPCNNKCMKGLVTCYNSNDEHVNIAKCLPEDMFGLQDYSYCNGKCLYNAAPCDGKCRGNRRLCKLDYQAGRETKQYERCLRNCPEKL